MKRVSEYQKESQRWKKSVKEIPGHIFDLLGNPKLLGTYVFLKAFEEGDGTASISLKYMAKNLKMSKRTAIRLIKRLEEIGVLKVERRKGKSNIYRFVDSSELKKDAESDEDVGILYLKSEIAMLRQELGELKKNLYLVLRILHSTGGTG